MRLARLQEIRRVGRWFRAGWRRAVALWPMAVHAVVKVRDRGRLRQRFGGLAQVGGWQKRLEEELQPHYEEWVREISSADMAVSLQTAVFLRRLCEALKPVSVLDLGSGFSSFVFRGYAAAVPGVSVCSLDDSAEWLARTATFLAARGLSTSRLLLWPDFERRDGESFDLVFHDLGSMALREQTLPLVLGWVRSRTGVLVLDDVHKADYRSSVRRVLGQRQCRAYDLSAYTHDQFGRYGMLVSDLSEEPPPGAREPSRKLPIEPIRGGARQ